MTEIYTDRFGGGGEIDPTVVHPTAAIPLLYNVIAAPFVFFVTDIPKTFRDFLIETAVLEVDSRLRVLFVENGVPIPHDYITALTNYNFRTDSEALKDQAKRKVRQSVIQLLFDNPSGTSQRVEAFIRVNRDNVSNDLSDEEAQLFVRDSVRAEILEIIIPGTKTLAPIYNIYIHPPTTNQERLDRWRKWIASQKFHAGNYGVGVKYQHSWRCNHCKTTDHPSGLCPHAGARNR